MSGSNHPPGGGRRPPQIFRVPPPPVRPPSPRVKDEGNFEFSHNRDYAVDRRDRTSLWVRRLPRADSPKPRRLFQEVPTTNRGYRQFIPRVQLGPKAGAHYAPKFGPNDCGRLADAMSAGGADDWGDNPVNRDNLVPVRKSAPQVGDVLVMHRHGGGARVPVAPPRAPCNFHAAGVTATDGQSFVTSEADAGDPGRNRPQFHVHGTKAGDHNWHESHAPEFVDIAPTGQALPPKTLVYNYLPPPPPGAGAPARRRPNILRNGMPPPPPVPQPPRGGGGYRLFAPPPPPPRAPVPVLAPPVPLVPARVPIVRNRRAMPAHVAPVFAPPPPPPWAPAPVLAPPVPARVPIVRNRRAMPAHVAPAFVPPPPPPPAPRKRRALAPPPDARAVAPRRTRIIRNPGGH